MTTHTLPDRESFYLGFATGNSDAKAHRPFRPDPDYPQAAYLQGYGAGYAAPYVPTLYYHSQVYEAWLASTCQLCGAPKPADRACECVDNPCQ